MPTWLIAVLTFLAGGGAGSALTYRITLRTKLQKFTQTGGDHATQVQGGRDVGNR